MDLTVRTLKGKSLGQFRILVVPVLCFSPFFSLGSKKIMKSKQLIMFTFSLLGYQEAQSLDQFPIFNESKPFKNPQEKK